MNLINQITTTLHTNNFTYKQRHNPMCCISHQYMHSFLFSFNLALAVVEMMSLYISIGVRDGCMPMIWYCVCICSITHLILSIALYLGMFVVYSNYCVPYGLDVADVQCQRERVLYLINIGSLFQSGIIFSLYTQISNECLSKTYDQYPLVTCMFYIELCLFYIGIVTILFVVTAYILYRISNVILQIYLYICVKQDNEQPNNINEQPNNINEQPNNINEQPNNQQVHMNEIGVVID